MEYQLFYICNLSLFMNCAMDVFIKKLFMCTISPLLILLTRLDAINMFFLQTNVYQVLYIIISSDRHDNVLFEFFLPALFDSSTGTTLIGNLEQHRNIYFQWYREYRPDGKLHIIVMTMYVDICCILIPCGIT